MSETPKKGFKNRKKETYRSYNKEYGDGNGFSCRLGSDQNRNRRRELAKPVPTRTGYDTNRTSTDGSNKTLEKKPT